jgi:hypothetical protein
LISRLRHHKGQQTMSNVIPFDKNTRLRIALTKAAETSRALAQTLSDPEARARLTAKAEAIMAQARAI